MRKFLFCLLVTFSCAGVFAQQQPVVAVFPFEDMDNVLTRNQAIMFYREFSIAFANRNAGRFPIVPRLEVDRLINTEFDFQLTVFSAQEKTAEMMRVQNAAQIISGAIGRLGNNIRISVSLYTYPELVQLPGGAVLSVSNTEELFNKIPELVQSMYNAIPVSIIIPGGNEDADGRPSWIYIPLNGRVKFETGNSGVSNWYYDVGQSNRTATEQLARNRAREDVQRMIAANIASEMKGRVNIASLSMFGSSDIEETANIIETVLTNSIRTRVPSYEVLEWYIERGNENGRNWFIAYLLVRFVRQDIIRGLEAINMQNAADIVIRNMNISASDSDRTAFIRELEASRDFSLGVIRNGSMGR